MRKIFLSLFILWVMAACSLPTLAAPALTTPAVTALPTASPTRAAIIPSLAPTLPTVTPLSVEQLKNCSYTSPDWGQFQLSDGIYYREPPTTLESAETYTTRLLDTVIFGDINEDGASDAVAFLATQSGGTGHFVEMAAMINDGGSPLNASTLFLGDRVIIESGVILDGIISVSMRVQGPNDPMCCPSQSVTYTYQLENGQLTLLQTIIH